MADIKKISDYNFEFLFEGLPDWAIPMMHIVPIFYLERACDVDNEDFAIGGEFNYMWLKIDNQNYKLLVRLTGGFTEKGIKFPLFVDLNCYFLNENIYEEIQHERG